MIRRRIDRPSPAQVRLANGWSSTSQRAAPWRSTRLVAFLLLLPLVFGLFGAPGSHSVVPTVRGDELSQAKAKAAALKKEIADQKAKVAALNDLQAGLAAEISSTKSELRKIGADLDAVKRKIKRMETRITAVKKTYEELVAQLEQMDAELVRLTAEEATKRAELTERRALLADRVRNAYDSDRTSPLETLLSGGTFTDMLAEMSYYIDIGEQDKALAKQITKDKETLATLRQTVADTRVRTNTLRQETAAQKRTLDRALKELKDTKAALRKLEKKVAKALRAQQSRYSALKRNKANAARIIAQAAADQRRLARKIDALIEKQVRRGNIPSRFSGTMRWPMDDFTVSGDYGCSSYDYYAPGNGCDHYHNGIDMVGSYGTRIKAAAAGTVVYVGWNWADGSDPAWIVVIAHSSNLRSWYAHMQPKRPVEVGEKVKKGQTIGYEGNTGNSTGAHLHWMVERNGDFVNPRLFL